MLQKISQAWKAHAETADRLSSGDLNIEVAILLALGRLGPLTTEQVRGAVGGSAGGTSRHLKTLRTGGDIAADLDAGHQDSLGRPRERSVYRLTEQGSERVAEISDRLAWLAQPKTKTPTAIPVVSRIQERRTASDPPMTGN